MAKRTINKQIVDVDGLEDLKPGTGVQVDENTKYEYGANLETENVPLIDPGGDGVVSIRVFTFKINPAQKFLPGKQVLFNAHAKQLEAILWGDGLRPLESNSPRVIINSKKGFYQIMVPCIAAKGVIWSDKDRNPELLHKQLAKGKLDSHKK